jgi:hypothetical protein
MVLANENLVPTMSSAAMTSYKPIVWTLKHLNKPSWQRVRRFKSSPRNQKLFPYSNFREPCNDPN